MMPACFVCGSGAICKHREPELVEHWMRFGAFRLTEHTAPAVVHPRVAVPAPAAKVSRVTFEDAWRRRA